MKWAGVVFLLLLTVALPAHVPSDWVRAGCLPEVALLGTLYVAFRGTGERAAWFGIVAGLLAAPWTDEPPLLRACVLGAVGLYLGGVSSLVDRERLPVAVAVTALAALVLRACEELALRSTAGGGSVPGAVASAMLVSVAVTSVAAPLFFVLVRRTALMRPLERSFRDV